MSTEEKPVALDFFSGKGGWTDGLLAAGFRVVGFDIKKYDGYRGEFVQRDMLTVTPEEVRSYNPRFICCSSPCEQFSVHGMKMFHKDPPYPEMGIKLFNYAKMLCESAGCLYVMENVRPAQDFVGPSVNHCGPFYLWGAGVPAIIPPECYKVTKGANMGSGTDVKSMTPEEKKEWRRQFPLMQTCSKSNARKTMTAMMATIPLSLSQYIGQFAMQSLELYA